MRRTKYLTSTLVFVAILIHFEIGSKIPLQNYHASNSFDYLRLTLLTSVQYYSEKI
jgi:hypothetical protein